MKEPQESNYTVVYLTDGMDLRYEEFTYESDARKFMEDIRYKSVLVGGDALEINN